LIFAHNARIAGTFSIAGENHQLCDLPRVCMQKSGFNIPPTLGNFPSLFLWHIEYVITTVSLPVIGVRCIMFWGCPLSVNSYCVWCNISSLSGTCHKYSSHEW